MMIIYCPVPCRHGPCRTIPAVHMLPVVPSCRPPRRPVPRRPRLHGAVRAGLRQGVVHVRRRLGGEAADGEGHRSEARAPPRTTDTCPAGGGGSWVRSGPQRSAVGRILRQREGVDDPAQQLGATLKLPPPQPAFLTHPPYDFIWIQLDAKGGFPCAALLPPKDGHPGGPQETPWLRHVYTAFRRRAVAHEIMPRLDHSDGDMHMISTS